MKIIITTENDKLSKLEQKYVNELCLCLDIRTDIELQYGRQFCHKRTLLSKRKLKKRNVENMIGLQTSITVDEPVSVN